jgi:hypothetical protein
LIGTSFYEVAIHTPYFVVKIQLTHKTVFLILPS